MDVGRDYCKTHNAPHRACFDHQGKRAVTRDGAMGAEKDEIGTLEQEFDRLLETVSNQSIELERELGFRKENSPGA